MPTWHDDIEGSKKQVYIEKFESSPLEVIVSFYSAMTKNKEKTGLLNMVASFGLALTTVEDAPIHLNALKMENVFGDVSEIAFVF